MSGLEVSDAACAMCAVALSLWAGRLFLRQPQEEMSWREWFAVGVGWSSREILP